MSGQLVDGEHVVAKGPLRLDRALRNVHGDVSWGTLRRAIRTGKVSVGGDVVREPGQMVAAGDALRVEMARARQPMMHLADDAVVHVDGQVVVVRKPAGIASVPDDNWRKGTVAQQLAKRVRKGGRRQVPLGVVQRLDVDTSGLMVFALTADAQHHLKEQFRRRDVERRYLAIVSGDARTTTYRSHLMEHANGKRASTRHRHMGKFACTHVELVEKLTGATLVACKLETGRTHQIRIQLSEAGHPLLGDKRYARRRVVTPPAPRVMLHAATLGFVHPELGNKLQFEEPLPEDMETVLAGLRATGSAD